MCDKSDTAQAEVMIHQSDEKSDTSQAEVMLQKSEKSDTAQAEVMIHQSEKSDTAQAEVMIQKSEKSDTAQAEVMIHHSDEKSDTSQAEVMLQNEEKTEASHAKVSSLTLNGILNGRMTSSIVINGANCNMTVTDILDMMRLVRETQDSTPQEVQCLHWPVEDGTSKEDNCLPRVEDGISKEDNCLPRVEDGTTLRVSGVFKGIVLNGVKLTIIPDKVEPQTIVRKKRAVEDVEDGEQSSKRLKDEDNV